MLSMAVLASPSMRALRALACDCNAGLAIVAEKAGWIVSLLAKALVPADGQTTRRNLSVRPFHMNAPSISIASRDNHVQIS